jgi:exportin-2 (importin alpha re-exporter)
MGKLVPLLGVFQKLISQKANDHEGFYLLQSLILNVEPASLQIHFNQIFLIIFQRLTSSKTTKYIKSALVFFSLFAHKFGVATLVSLIDNLQPGMFGMVLDKLFLAEVQKVSGTLERKICAVGMTTFLCDYPDLIEGAYAPFWPKVLQALISLFELPEDESIPDDEHFIEIEDTIGYQASYAQLVFSGKKDDDPLADVPDARQHLALKLQAVSQKYPGRVLPLIQSGLDQTAAGYLQQYLQKAGVSIA